MDVKGESHEGKQQVKGPVRPSREMSNCVERAKLKRQEDKKQKATH